MVKLNIYSKLENRITPHSNLVLLVLVFFLVFLISFFPATLHQSISNILFSLIFFVSTFALRTGRKKLFTIAIIAFITEWVSAWLKMPVLNYLSLVINILFFQVVVIKLIIQVARSKRADASIIFESINGYLMLGLMFSTWVAVLLQYDPAALNFKSEMLTIQDYIYFTFVTMTTLGYGDVVPVVPTAKSMAILISTTGQIYIAVVIAMLVGKYAASQNQKQ
jgi:hypothetical protein